MNSATKHLCLKLITKQIILMEMHLTMYYPDPSSARTLEERELYLDIKREYEDAKRDLEKNE